MGFNLSEWALRHRSFVAYLMIASIIADTVAFRGLGRDEDPAFVMGLTRILRGPSDADRLMAAQLLGTGGIAALLLLAAGMGVPAAVDAAFTLALLAAFAGVAFVISAGDQ